MVDLEKYSNAPLVCVKFIYWHALFFQANLHQFLCSDSYMEHKPFLKLPSGNLT